MSMAVIFPLLFGLLVLVLASYVLRRQEALGRRRFHSSSPQNQIPLQVAESLFQLRDLEYVQQRCSGEVLALFRSERKRLALLWLKEIRLQAGDVFRAHTEQARTNARLESSTELRIALRYWSLLGTCVFATAIIYLFGPFKAHSFARHAGRLSHGLNETLTVTSTAISVSSTAWPGPSRQA